jgi:hypothetical protein
LLLLPEDESLLEVLDELLGVELYRSLYQPPPLSANELWLTSLITGLPHVEQTFNGSSVIRCIASN